MLVEQWSSPFVKGTKYRAQARVFDVTLKAWCIAYGYGATEFDATVDLWKNMKSVTG